MADNNLKTPWKKLQNKDYLGEHDFLPGEEKTVTIKHINIKEVTGDGGVVSSKPIMSFHESVKPLIVNTTNFKMMQRLFKSKYVEDWYGEKVILYGDPNVKFGRDVVGGVRVKNELPIEKQSACADCGQVVAGSKTFTAEQIIQAGLNRFGRVVCLDCASALKAKEQPAPPVETKQEAANDAEA